MLQTLWKLTFLTGVVGVGLLVVLQAKKGMQLSGENSPDPAASTSADAQKSPGAVVAKTKPQTSPKSKTTDKVVAASHKNVALAKSGSTAATSKKNEKPLPTTGDPFGANSSDETLPSTVHPVAGHQKEGSANKGIRVLSFDDDLPTTAAGKSTDPLRKKDAVAAKGSPKARDRDLPTTEISDADLTASLPALGAPDRDGELSGVRPVSGTSPPVNSKPRTTGDSKPRSGAGAPLRSAATEGADPFAVEKPASPGLRVPPPTEESPLSVGPSSTTPKPSPEKPAADSVELPEVAPVTPVKPTTLPRQPVPAGEEDAQPILPRGASGSGRSTSLPPASGLPAADTPNATGGATLPGISGGNDSDTVDVSPPPADRTPRTNSGTTGTPVLPSPGATPVLPSGTDDGPTPVLPAAPSPIKSTTPTSVPEIPVAVPVTPQPRQRPRVKIEKVAPPNATLGQPMIYHIHIRNVGQVAAHQVTVEDTVPKGVNLDGTIPQAELVGDKLTWRMGTLEPRNEKKISIRVVPITEGEVGSVATVKFSQEPGALPAGAVPRLEFQLTGPPQATVGSSVSYTFRVANVGRADAHHVVIQNVLPPGLRHADGDDLVYEVGLLGAGLSKEVTLPLTAAQLGRTVNRAVVTADGGISVPAQSPLEIVSPNLSIQRTGPPRILLNRQGIFTNTLTNSSAQGLKSLTLSEAVPVGFEFVSATNDGRFDAARKVVTWSIDQLGSQQSRSVQVTLKSIGRGSQVSVVRAYDGAGATGETFGTTHIAGVAAVSVDVVDIPSFLEVGQQATFKVRIRNRGTDTADNIRATVVLPSGTDLVSLNGGKYRRTGDELVFEAIPRLEPKHEAVVELTIKGLQPQESRLQVLIQNDATSTPLRRDEAFSVIAAP